MRTSAIDNDLTRTLYEDIAGGRPSYGIHKDSISFKFNGVEAKNIASQGQLRILGIALKFAEGVTIKAMGGGELPVFILDDVMSELDRKTQLKITEIFCISRHDQLKIAVFIVSRRPYHRYKRIYHPDNIKRRVVYIYVHTSHPRKQRRKNCRARYVRVGF